MKIGRSSLLACCFNAVAQTRPVNVRAEILAAHDAMGGAFDVWAAFGGYFAVHPLPDGLI